MSLTREVAEFVYGTRYGDVPEEVIRSAKGFVLDGLGVILAGSTEKGSRIIQSHVRQMGGRSEATILGTGHTAPVPKAALVNG